MGEPLGQTNSCCGPAVLVGNVVIVLVFDVEGVALVVSADLDVTVVDFEVGIVLDVEVVTLAVCDDLDVGVVSFEVVVGLDVEVVVLVVCDDLEVTVVALEVALVVADDLDVTVVLTFEVVLAVCDSLDVVVGFEGGMVNGESKQPMSAVAFKFTVSQYHSSGTGGLFPMTK